MYPPLSKSLTHYYCCEWASYCMVVEIPLQKCLYMALPGVSAVMKKLQFGDELAGHILYEFECLIFPNPVGF